MSVFGAFVKAGARSMKGASPGGLALTAGMGVLDYGMRVAEGDSAGSAFLGAAGTTALWAIAPALGMASMLYDVTKGTTEALYTAYHQGKGPYSQAYQANFGRGFLDTATRQTMRQRSVAALRDSQMQGRGVLGREAMMVHRNNLRDW